MGDILPSNWPGGWELEKGGEHGMGTQERGGTSRRPANGLWKVAERHRSESGRRSTSGSSDVAGLMGWKGWVELSRAPLAHPRQVGDLWRERVRSARLEHPRWGR